MEQNGTFLENSEYDYWILHKKLVEDETITIIHIFVHISLNIDPRILNPHTPEYPFPSAGHSSYQYITGEPLALSVENYSRGTLLRVYPA